MREHDLVGLVEAIRPGETTARADMRERIARIGALNPRLNAVLDLHAAKALYLAEKADPRLPPAGVALGHKNMVCRRGRRVTYGSKIMEGRRAGRTATAARRLGAGGRPAHRQAFRRGPHPEDCRCLPARYVPAPAFAGPARPDTLGCPDPGGATYD